MRMHLTASGWGYERRGDAERLISDDMKSGRLVDVQQRLPELQLLEP